MSACTSVRAYVGVCTKTSLCNYRHHRQGPEVSGRYDGLSSCITVPTLIIHRVQRSSPDVSLYLPSSYIGFSGLVQMYHCTYPHQT